MQKKHKKEIEMNKYLIFSICFIIFILGIFSIKFHKYSFVESTPENWVTFIEYFTGLINPVLALLNLLFFVRLTKSIENQAKKASINKAWIEKAENLTFDFFDAVSRETSFFALFYAKLKDKTSTEQTEYIKKSKEKIEIMSDTITECEFRLRTYIETDLFKEINSRRGFLEVTKQVMNRINEFINVSNFNEIQKEQKLIIAYNNLVAIQKEVLETGKTFTKEIHSLE